MASPTRNAMRIIHLSAYFSSATFSHLRMAQKTRAVKNPEDANTIASTAENQKESENQYAIEPTIPAAITAIILPLVY